MTSAVTVMLSVSARRESFNDMGRSSIRQTIDDDEAVAKETRAGKIVVDTMELIEPTFSGPVPNHIAETKMYCKVAANGLIKVFPSVIHFMGFEPGRYFVQKLRLQNMSTEIQQMNIIPPQTNYFKIKYAKKQKLVPGFALNCLIEFFPEEWRYYYDSIRIHSKSEKNLIIPIHAYPVMDSSEFPQLIDFPAVALGHTKTKVFPLRSRVPVDFEFRLTLLQPHPTFKVEPMNGVIPANGKVDICVSFTPSSFSSAFMKMQLDISQFLAHPLTCVVTGCCLPGMKCDAVHSTDASVITSVQTHPKTLDPVLISPLDRARSRKVTAKSHLTGTILNLKPQVKEIDGVRIPPDLSNPHSVAVVLNQKPGKLQVKDLQSTVFGSQTKPKAITRQIKEAMFDVAMRSDAYNERQNQLRWQVKLGEDAISAEFCDCLLTDREEAQQIYKLQRGDLDEEEECPQISSKLSSRKTRRLASMVLPNVASFDAFLNDLWQRRHTVISRFQQAARRIIIQLRVKPRLQTLGKNLECQKNIKIDSDMTLGTLTSVSDQPLGNSWETLNLNLANVSSVVFPVSMAAYAQNEQDVLCPSGLPAKQKELLLKENVPYFALKVPQQYKILGYQPFRVQDASSSYVTLQLVKPLLSGAEDELVNLGFPPSNEVMSEFVPSGPNYSLPESHKLEVAILDPPKAMLEPLGYSALHVFNPLPGLLIFKSHLPYSEADSDFHLCPLPRFSSINVIQSHLATQKQYLTRQDIMKDVMSWKKFPSTSTKTLTGTSTLSNLWVPRWKDPFSQELLPYSVPLLLDSPSSDYTTKFFRHYDTVENETQVTPEIVRSRFLASDFGCEKEEEAKNDIPVALVPETDDHSPGNLTFGEACTVPRAQCELNLELFLKKKFGILQQKLHSRIHDVDTLRNRKLHIQE